MSERQQTGEESRPIRDDELERLFSGLERFDAVVAAVSGGADSMALLALLARWRHWRGSDIPPIRVATVDHRLRPGSADEARFVAKAAAAAGLEHAVLAWEDERPRSGVQAAARSARYRLLAAHARVLGARPAIVTAHTEDDQAETLMMRLARGSGLDGLAAMARVRPVEHGSAVTLVRPLLDVGKDRLVATLEERGLRWLEDPSNENTDFERVRLRRAAPLLAALGLENSHLALAARRLGRARHALELAARSAFDDVIDVHGGLFATADRAALSRYPEELRLRVLSRTLRAFGGSAPSPRLSQIEQLAGDLDRGQTGARTLGGCVVSAGRRTLRVYREAGRSELPIIRLRAGQTATWDDRFEVAYAGSDRLPATGGREITVRALGDDAHATLARMSGKSPLPFGAARGLPSFWHGGDLVAVPPLSFAEPPLVGSGEGGHAVCTTRFLGAEPWDGLRRNGEHE